MQQSRPTAWFLFSAISLLLAAIALGAGIVLLLGSREADVVPPAVSPRISLGLQLTATDENGQGVSPQTHFLLSSRQPLGAQEVRAALVIQPAVDYRLEAAGTNQYHVIPGTALEPNRVYHVTYRPAATGALEASWAFQVRSPLRVVATLPAHETAFVPLDTGIEITFSHDGIERPQDFVEITPRPEGRFEHHKRTLVFVPSRLEPDTLYSVRVRAGLPLANSDLRLEGDVVFQFETGTTARGSGPQSVLRLDFLHRVAEAASREAPLVSVVTDDASLATLPVEVFAYPSLDAFIRDLSTREEIPVWASGTRAKSLVDTAPLQRVLSFEATIEGRPAGSGPQFGLFGPPRLFFRLPGPLPDGLYLLQTVYRDRPVQAWLQVTDIATYVAVSETSTLVWVNDVSTGQPLQGVQVEVIGRGLLGRTDAQGIASFATPDYLTQKTSGVQAPGRAFALSFLRIGDGRGRTAIVPLSPVLPPSLMSGRCGAFVDFGFGGLGTDYWAFATTERPMYQPNDTVHFWGIARHRDGSVERELQVRLSGFALGSGTQTLGATRGLRTSDLGTFSGELQLEGVDPGYYTLVILEGGRTVTAASFRVETYIKPAYRLSVRPERPAYIAGEQVNVEVEAAFFDGTPLPGLELRRSGGEPATITTGPDGRARFSFTAQGHQHGGDLTNIYVTPVNAEEAEISGSAVIFVFPAAVQLGGKATYDAGTGAMMVEADLLRVDTALYEAVGYNPYGPSTQRPRHLSAPAAGRPVSISIVETYFEAVRVGERYDFINKVTLPVHRYESRERPLGEATATTDAQGRIVYTFPAAEGSSYRVMLSATDEAGHTTTLTIFGRGVASDFFRDSGLAYLTAGDSGDVFFSQGQLSLGEPFAVTLRRGSSPLPSGGVNRYLFYEGQRGIRHFAVQDNPVYRGAFSERHIPSATIGGVYFNGFTYIEAQYGPTLVFNPEARRLRIELSPGKDLYGPGEEASVEVVVRDLEGRPVAAEVFVSAVDEAVFAVADFNPYQTAVLEALYRPVPSGIIRTYASHQYPPQLLEPGGRGGNGGARGDFADVAFAGTVRTDSSGRGRVSFQTPDNLTSWRVVAYAVSADLKAGRGEGSVRVGLPFFLDVALNRDYLVSDRPSVSVRAFGTALRGGEQVEFVLKAPSLGLDQGMRASGRAFETVQMKLPALREGEHEITVEARSGRLEDAVKRPISVVESRSLVPRVTFYDPITSGTRLQGSSSGRTTVVFMEAGKGSVYPLLQRLAWSYGDRADQVLARQLASKLLAEHFGESVTPPQIEPTAYLRPLVPGARRSGVAILPYADPDLSLTAWAAALAPDVFGRALLRNALQAVVQDRGETPERAAIAYFGLAALGEPVLVDVRALGQNPELGWRGRLYVALALEAVGDHPGAAALLASLIDSLGEETPPYLRLRAGADQDDILEATALAAVVAAGVGDERAEKLMRYVRDNAASDVLLSLQEVAYARNALDRLAGERTVFTVTIDGRREEVTLQRGATRSFSLPPMELSRLRIEVGEGRLAAAVRQMVPLKDAGLTRSRDVSITRSVSAGGQTGTTLPATELVEVTLRFTLGPQAPDGCYQVTDILPSGLKPVTRPATFSTRGPPRRPPPLPGQPEPPPVIYPYLADGQRVSFCVTKGGPATLRYFARPSARGEFTWEPATIHNQRAPSVFNLSDPGRIVIE